MDMGAKEFLGHLKVLNDEINQKLDKISALRASLTSIPAINNTKERVQASVDASNARFVKTLAEISELEAEVSVDIDNYVDAKREIINRIYKLNNKLQRKILYKRYIEFKNFNEIADDVKHTYRYVLNIHKKALDEFANNI